MGAEDAGVTAPLQYGTGPGWLPLPAGTAAGSGAVRELAVRGHTHTHTHPTNGAVMKGWVEEMRGMRWMNPSHSYFADFAGIVGE